MGSNQEDLGEVLIVGGMFLWFVLSMGFVFGIAILRLLIGWLLS